MVFNMQAIKSRSKLKNIYLLLSIIIFLLFTTQVSLVAKMDPLHVLDERLVRANILILLDTSGSMQLDPNGNVLDTPDAEGRYYTAHENSRMAIAKSTVIQVLNELRDVANFGLMSLKQTHFKNADTSKGYFPYFKIITGQKSVSGTAYFSRHALKRPIYTVNGVTRQQANSGTPCFEPVPAFVLNGISYTLCSVNNSLYSRRGGGKNQDIKYNYCKEAWHPYPVYCNGGQGQFCVLEDPKDKKLYEWNYQGSFYDYYTYDINDLSKVVYFSEYYGPAFVATGREDENGGASVSVDPNEKFVYFQGVEGINFKYPEAATWTDQYPIGAPGLIETTRGGTLLVPFSYSTDPIVQGANVDRIAEWMNPPKFGGLISLGHDYLGSALLNANPDANYFDDAYSYFVNEVLENDPQSCRKNFILIVTDGSPSPGWQEFLEEASGIIATLTLYPQLNIQIFVIGFGADTDGSQNLDLLAKLGGAPQRENGHYAFFVSDITSLINAIRDSIYEASAGDYSTAAPSVITSSNSKFTGNIGLLTTTEFPAWYGHLIAHDMVNDTKIWDAGEQLDSNHVVYNQRHIFTSDPSGKLVPFFINGTPNDTALNLLGLGASNEETSSIINFIAGQDRHWRLMDITNCVPISVGPPYKQTQPGHEVFESIYSNRKTVIYSGGNDCMFHCFALSDGQELFAYVPPDLLPKLALLYHANGQPSSPKEHIYGIAASPKAFDAMIGSTWRTVVVCGEGPGGNHFFALDVTHPSPGDPGFSISEPFTVLWHTKDSHINSIYEPLIGQTWSTPALGKILSSGNPLYAAFFGSGYKTAPDAPATEGQTFIVAQFGTGSNSGSPIFTKYLEATSTYVEHGLVSDAVITEDNGLITDAYIADTSGRIWHLDTASDPILWSMKIIYDAGPNQPFFYSPAVLKIGQGESACTVMVAGSGTYDEPEINKSDSKFISKIYLLSHNNNNIVSESAAISLSDLQIDSNTGNFPARARFNAPPIILRNKSTSQYEALFLVYVPPALTECDPGSSYLVVYRLGKFGECGFSEKQMITIIDAGVGKLTGISIAGSSAALLSVTGYGAGARSLVRALPSTPSPLPGNVKQLYWKEVE